jgi:hypothetical protein
MPDFAAMSVVHVPTIVVSVTVYLRFEIVWALATKSPTIVKATANSMILLIDLRYHPTAFPQAESR